MSKEDKLTYLFDEIGSISDSFVNEALIIKHKRSGVLMFMRSVSVAAVVAVLTVIGIFTVASIASGDGSSDHNDALTTTTVNDSANSNEQRPSEPPSFDRDSDAITYLKDAIDDRGPESFEQVTFADNNNDTLFDGNVRLIWTYGDSVYYSVTVARPRDIVAIEDYLASDAHRVKTDDPENDNFRFWISYGDGRTTSPFLENNVGGTSFGELSDYVPEVYPSYEFAQFIAELIEDA